MPPGLSKIVQGKEDRTSLICGDIFLYTIAPKKPSRSKCRRASAMVFIPAPDQAAITPYYNTTTTTQNNSAHFDHKSSVC